MADTVAAVATTGEEAVALLTAGEGALAVRTPPHNGLLPAGTGATGGEGLAGWARARVALQDADMWAPAAFIRGRCRVAVEGLAAGLAAGVGGEVEVVGGVAASAAEAGVGEVLGGGGLDGLAAGAAPGAAAAVGGGCGGEVGGGGGAGPLADAMEVEDGETAGAGPDRGGAADHVVADHALDRAPRELILDLLHELRHRPGLRRCRRW